MTLIRVCSKISARIPAQKLIDAEELGSKCRHSLVIKISDCLFYQDKSDCIDGHLIRVASPF